MKRAIVVVLGISLMLLGIASLASAATPFLSVAKETGITILEEKGVTAWTGPYGGKIKPRGPLAGKKIGIAVGCEFSDWQAYYFASFIAEFGGTPQFVMDNNHLWKSTRPMIGIPTEPAGMWGLTLTGGMSGLGMNGNRTEFPVVMKKGEGLAADYKVADPKKYDALIIIGGHSGDIMYPDDVALAFIKAVADRGVPIVGIGGGILPMIQLDLVNGKKCTGNASVDYMLKAIAKFQNEPVVTDGKIITGRDTVDSPAVLRALIKVMNPSFQDKHKGILKGKKVMAMVADDWEDIELAAPALELMYRGADFIVGLFEPEMRNRPYADFRVGNFGMTIPFQEIPLSYYKIIKQKDLKMSDFDLVYIPGAFNPWNITVLHRDWLRDAYANGKLIAPICHGPIPVAAADLIRGKKCAGWLASKHAVNLMGGEFMPDWAAAIDGQIVSGRTPPEVPEFVDAITEALLRQ
ncbi:MAG: DJ-1/PfpI family protein [candidate division NC10 bacterium]|nr:DJ-1/PfpI family protein [candidate division NC10 bacterium]